MKNFCEDLFFFLESTCACVLGPWPWPRAFLSLASRVSVLGKAVLGLGFLLLSLALASSLVSSTPPLMHALKMLVRTGAITEPDIFIYFAGIPCLPVLYCNSSLM